MKCMNCGEQESGFIVPGTNLSLCAQCAVKVQEGLEDLLRALSKLRPIKRRRVEERQLEEEQKEAETQV